MPNAPNAPAAAEALNPELFTGIVRGVLSSMMGSLGQAQNDTESIAQFMQRLSQATNIFISPEDPTGKEQQLRATGSTSGHYLNVTNHFTYHLLIHGFV